MASISAWHLMAEMVVLAEALEAEGLIRYETKDSLLYAIVTVDGQGGSL